MKLDCKSLSSLADLKSLKSLSFDGVAVEDPAQGDDLPSPERLPVLPRLEALHMYGDIGDRDLGCFAGCACLKSLNLMFSQVTSAGLAHLASLRSLEEVSLDKDMLTPEGIAALCAVKRLKKVHVKIVYGSLLPATQVALDDGNVLEASENERGAWEAFRQSHPDVVIDGNDRALEWHVDETILSDYPYLYCRMHDSPRLGLWKCWQWRKERN